MHNDIEFVKYCASKVEGWEWKEGSGIDGVLSPANSAVFTVDKSGHLSGGIVRKLWEPIYFPLLLSQTCDALGISIVKTENVNYAYESYSFFGGGYSDANSARVSAIKKYMEVEGESN